MRSKILVPVGQGCKRPVIRKGVLRTGDGFRCQTHPEYYLNICLGCGQKFHTKAPHTKTCGNACRKRLSRSRKEVLFQSIMNFATGGQS